MPKSRRRKSRKGPNPGPKLPNMKEIEALARALDTPELRAIYRRQKKINPDLDQECDDFFKGIEEIFKHGNDSQES